MDEFNMYSEFITDNTFATLPYFNIKETGDDAYVEWSIGNRLDRLAYTYYNDSSLWWIIASANNIHNAIFAFEDGTVLRIPTNYIEIVNNFS